MAGRFFSGTRSSSGGSSGKSTVTLLMREQIKKNGKIDFAEINKKLLKKKLDDARFKAASGENSAFNTFGKVSAPQRSKRAEEMAQYMQAQQAAKEAKKERKAVSIEAKRLANGNIDKKGRVFDVAGNQVAQVNAKTGAISTVYGQYIGAYKEKSYMTKMALQEAINKNSPYLINQRKMIEQQRQQQMQPQLGAGFAQTSQADNIWGTGEGQKDIWGNITGFFGF